MSSDVTLIVDQGLTRIATPDEEFPAWIIETEAAIVSILLGSTRPSFDSMVDDAEAIIDSIVWGSP